MTENVMWPLPPRLPEDDEQQEQDAPDAQDADAWENLQPVKQLADVLHWLRSEYFYCVFCGCQVRAAIEWAFDVWQLCNSQSRLAMSVLSWCVGGRSTLMPSSSRVSAQE